MHFIKVLTVFLLFTGILSGGEPPSDKARGMFFSVAVGPRIPIGEFSNNSVLGYGFNLELSYADNELLPFFLFGKIGFEQFPGSQNLYQISDYSSFSTSALPLSFGARYYFAPILENFVVILPSIEFMTHLTIMQKLHQFKSSLGKADFIEEGTKLGFTAGISASMFILEILASYTYYKNNQYLGFDLKVRLPLYVSL